MLCVSCWYHTIYWWEIKVVKSLMQEEKIKDHSCRVSDQVCLVSFLISSLLNIFSLTFCVKIQIFLDYSYVPI